MSVQAEALIFFNEALSNTDIYVLFGSEKQIESVHLLDLLNPTLIIEEKAVGGF